MSNIKLGHGKKMRSGFGYALAALILHITCSAPAPSAHADTPEFAVNGDRRDTLAKSSNTLRFPPKSVGLLYDMGPVTSRMPGNFTERSSVQAAGQRVYPGSHLLHLKVNYFGAQNMRWMDALAPDSLASLDLAKTQVTDASILPMRRLTGIERLLLSNTEITDEGLRSVGHIERLRSLTVSKTNIKGPGLLHLRARIRLRKLDLGFNEINEDYIHLLMKVERLEQLLMVNCNLSDRGIKILATLPSIRKLVLNQNNRITDACMPALIASRVGRLELIDTGVSAGGIMSLTTKKNLTSLKVRKGLLTPAQLAAFRRQLPTCIIDEVTSSEHIPLEVFEPLH